MCARVAEHQREAACHAGHVHAEVDWQLLCVAKRRVVDRRSFVSAVPRRLILDGHVAVGRSTLATWPAHGQADTPRSRCAFKCSRVVFWSSSHVCKYMSHRP